MRLVGNGIRGARDSRLRPGGSMSLNAAARAVVTVPLRAVLWQMHLGE